MPAATTPSSLIPGDVLADRFVVEAVAGHGGLGVVFRGWDLEQERAVAIKLLAELTATDARFRREAALLAELQLPGVVRYVAHGETPSGAPYLVMEWLDGVTVATRMERTGFTAAEAVALVRAACTPLAELHARGLIHRDLKPENLVMTSEDPRSVVLIDLGLARTAARLEARLTATGVGLGTPGYMAPELIRGEASIDGRADVFALGCVLYELLTGYAPFAGDNPLAVRTKILLTSPPSLLALCPEAPLALEHTVLAMIAKDRAQRPATAAEVDAALAALAALAAGPRRTWNPTRPPTTPHRTLDRDGARAPVEIAAAEAWDGVVLVQTPEAGDSLRAALAALGGQLDVIEDGALVVHLSAATLAELAPRLVRVARTIRAHSTDARIVIGSGQGQVDALIDQAAVVLVHASRAALFERDAAAGVGFVVLDDATAGALSAGGFALEHGPAGYRLVDDCR